MIKKIIINKQGKKFYLTDITKDFHTQFGFLKSADLKKKDGSLLKTNKDEEFYIFTPTFSDLYDKIRRDVQIITRKDVGEIIAYTGLNKESRVLDAGAGSGALCCFLANICKEVIAYDIRDASLKTTEENMKMMGLENLRIEKKDVYQGIDEKELDVITLDLPEPWNALQHCEKALKHGGFLVCYLPSITQVSRLIAEAKKYELFIYLKTAEFLERNWKIDGALIARPETEMLGHTGFLTFIRKV